MSGPIADYELGKRLHQEYEAEVSPCWGKVPATRQTPILAERHKVALALSGAVAFVGIIVGALAF